MPAWYNVTKQIRRIYMELHIALNKMRTEAHLTQEKFAEIMGVSQQSVQKWESGASTPDLEKLIFISKYFDVSLDTLIIGANGRIIEERHRKKPLPHSIKICTSGKFIAQTYP